MPITIGVDCRTTLGYVSGGASGNGGNVNYYAELASAVLDYPVSFGGTTIGWEDSNANGNSRDRDNTLDVRLAGCMIEGAGATSNFRIDLPTAGTYSIQVALGDAYGAHANMQLTIKDDTTTKVTISGSTLGANQWFGADNVLYTSSAAWAAANTVDGGGAAQIDVAFSSATGPGGGPIARFTLADGVNLAAIAHIFITGPAGGPPDTSLMGQIML